MKSVVFMKNSNTMTGCRYTFGLADGFYSTFDAIYNIDAPYATPSGSTVENVISHLDDDINGRYVVPGIVVWNQ
jgi:hypothetical protein